MLQHKREKKPNKSDQNNKDKSFLLGTFHSATKPDAAKSNLCEPDTDNPNVNVLVPAWVSILPKPKWKS